MGGSGSGRTPVDVATDNAGVLRLRAYMRETKQNQTDLARQLGIHPGQLSNYLRGARRPSNDLAFQIERATGKRVAAELWTQEAKGGDCEHLK